MHRRLAVAVVAVIALATLAGCSTVFGGISDEALDREATYDDLRTEETTVAVDLEGGSLIQDGSFRAVYDLNDTDEVSLYRESFYQERPLDIYGVQYWYPNGTVVTGSDLDVDQSRSSTDISVPDGNGTLAFSGSTGGKTFQLPAYVEGSYVVYTPSEHRTSNFLFGDVTPDGYDRTIVDGQERLHWEHVDSTISLRYYMARDIPLFLGLIGVVAVLGGVGIVYTYRQINRLRKQREVLGLDVYDDDSDDSPPGFG